MNTFSAIISLWKSAVELAGDIDVKPGSVRQWISRNRIPPEYWNSIVRAAAGRGFTEVTLSLLADIAEREGRGKSPERIAA